MTNVNLKENDSDEDLEDTDEIVDVSLDNFDKLSQIRIHSLNFARDLALWHSQFSWETSKAQNISSIEDILANAEKVFSYIMMERSGEEE